MLLSREQQSSVCPIFSRTEMLNEPQYQQQQLGDPEQNHAEIAGSSDRCEADSRHLISRQQLLESQQHRRHVGTPLPHPTYDRPGKTHLPSDQSEARASGRVQEGMVGLTSADNRSMLKFGQRCLRRCARLKLSVGVLEAQGSYAVH